jgi:hypothetical protein
MRTIETIIHGESLNLKLLKLLWEDPQERRRVQIAMDAVMVGEILHKSRRTLLEAVESFLRHKTKKVWTDSTITEEEIICASLQYEEFIMSLPSADERWLYDYELGKTLSGLLGLLNRADNKAHRLDQWSPEVWGIKSEPE